MRIQFSLKGYALNYELTACYYIIAGASIISLFYESMQKRLGSVGIHIAYGGISRGKTTAAKIALAVCCNLQKGYTISLSESLARRYLRGAVPYVYDDPSDDNVVKDLLMNAFGGAGMGTAREQLSARSSPIVTANEFLIDDLSHDVDR